MKAKRETPRRRGAADGRGGRDRSAHNSRRTAADSPSSRRTRHATTPAPTREPRSPKSGPQTSPIARPVERSASPKTTSQAKARAKARKAKAPKVVRPRLTERLAARLASIDLRPRTLASKVPFVVLVIGALALGLGLTLWLSTDSAERSYRLSHAREKTRLLQQQKEALERDVREAESAPALAEAARKQGMIPTRDTAHLVQDPSGNWVVVGTPKPADGVPPPPLNTRLPDPAPPGPPKPPELPPEVPVLVQPALGGPAGAGRSGPEALLRAPDGSSTVGGQHLPQTVPQLPGIPNGSVTAQLPGVMPTPGLPVPAGPAPALGPAEVPVPVGGMPIPVPAQVPAPLSAEVPVPVPPGMAASPLPAQAPVPAPQPAPPATGAQFGPATVATPGAPR
jgi:hypothetical protein